MRKRVAALVAIGAIALSTSFLTLIHGDHKSLSGTLIYHRYSDYEIGRAHV
jgi:hypothetical protein